jgi:hypothetical protein
MGEQIAKTWTQPVMRHPAWGDEGFDPRQNRPHPFDAMPVGISAAASPLLANARATASRAGGRHTAVLVSSQPQVERDDR